MVQQVQDEARPLRLHGLRVLVVEDRHTVARNVVRMLQLVGCKAVGPCGNLAAAFEIIGSGERSCDAAVLDIDLQGERVYPLARALIEMRIPLVFASGYGSPAVAEDWRDFPRLEKPFNAGQLERALMRALMEPHGEPPASDAEGVLSDTVRRAWEAIREKRDLGAEMNGIPRQKKRPGI